MPGVTDPSEEYFKDGLWAWVTDQWKKLIGDAAGHLQVDVVESGLPSGASTAAIQATMLTALQSIQNLVGALHDVGLDELDINITSQSADVEVKQTAAADLTPGIMGWDGAAWHKLPLIYGYSEHWVESLADADASAGDDALVTTSVADGYVYVMQSVCLRWTGASCSLVQLQVSSAGNYIILNESTSPVSGEWLVWNGEIVLPKDGFARAAFSGLTALDDIYLRVWGYKMKIAE